MAFPLKEHGSLKRCLHTGVCTCSLVTIDSHILVEYSSTEIQDTITTPTPSLQAHIAVGNTLMCSPLPQANK